MSERIELDVDLVARLWDIQEAIQRTMDLVSLGLSAQLPPRAGRRHVFPGLPFQINTTRQSPLQVGELQGSYESWLLNNGFRELIAYAGDHLDAVRDVCAALKLIAAEDFSSRSHDFLANWQSNEVLERRRFHKTALPRKIGHLCTTYSSVLETPLKIAIESINAVRNCCVHRRGLITAGVDATAESPLRLCWIGVTLETFGNDGELKDINELTDLGPGLHMFGSRPCAKLFEVDEHVRVTNREFNEIALTVYIFAKEMINRVYQFAVEIGLDLDEELERIWKRPSEIYIYLNTGPGDRTHHQAVPVDWRDGRLRFASNISSDEIA